MMNCLDNDQEGTPRRSSRVRLAAVSAAAAAVSLATTTTTSVLATPAPTPVALMVSPNPTTPTNRGASRRLDFASFCAPQDDSSSSTKKQRGPSGRKWTVVTPSPSAKKTKRKPLSPMTPTSSKKKNRTNSSSGTSPAGQAKAPLTESFGATWAGNFPSLQDKNIQPHTLILGTHPSIESLKEKQYYGHSQNAFWWIAGDALKFRRSSGVSPSSGKPYKLSSYLLYDNSYVIPYEQQLELFCSKGFAIWDVLKSCEREGSLDSKISNDIPNDIETFCQQHPTIQRIVFSNGKSSCDFFIKHFKDNWLKSGQLIPDDNEVSQKIFKKWAVVPTTTKTAPSLSTSSKKSNSKTLKDNGEYPRVIKLISALAVSPAAATYSYEEKRDFWIKYVYGPGLVEHDAMLQQNEKEE